MTANTVDRLPRSLTSTQVVKLTDAASELFRTLYGLERAHKQAAKVRLAEELARVDLFGPGLHYVSHEDYIPSGDAA